MHRCKVKTHQTTTITQEEYTSMFEIIAQDGFVNAIALASDCIRGEHKERSTIVHQESFCLPMKRTIFGLLTVPIYVNQEIRTFIIDTGAQVSGLRKKVIRDINLERTSGKLSVGSIGGKEKTMSGIMVPTIRLGGIEYQNMPMIELDDDFTLRFGNLDLFHFDGILGWDVLSELDFEMDDINKTFKVLKNKFRFDHPNMIKGGFPVFLTKQENGNLSVFGFDSGSKVSWIGENAISTHRLHVVTESDAMGFGVHGLERMNIKIIQEAQFYLDRAQITLKNTMSGRTNLFPAFTFDGVFGNEIFKGRRIRIVNSKGMVLLV